MKEIYLKDNNSLSMWLDDNGREVTVFNGDCSIADVHHKLILHHKLDLGTRILIESKDTVKDGYDVYKTTTYSVVKYDDFYHEIKEEDNDYELTIK